MNLRKSIALACVVGLMASFTACGNNKKDEIAEDDGKYTASNTEMTTKSDNIITTVENMIDDAVTDMSEIVSEVLPDMTTEN